MHHEFSGKWITDAEFAAIAPRNVFHRQLQPLDLTPDAHPNRHILFRRRFTLPEPPRRARLYITADDYYKLYLNGTFVAQGPAPSYPFRCGYNEIDVTLYLRPGENVLAVHTLYQGLINRVWVSGDDRHGLLCDLECDGRMTLCSDESFRTHPHTGYTACGIVGYQTQFLEDYDSAAPEAHFADPAFDDRDWPAAQARQTVDYTVVPQQTAQLVFERIAPVSQQRDGRTVTLDFGSCFVGYLTMQAVGAPGSRIRVRCGQELDASGRVRWQLRANCNYEEHWALSGGRDTLDWFDYRSFRYAELELPDGCTIADPCLIARHYPFRCTRAMDPAFAADPALQAVWALCVHSLHYGVQDASSLAFADESFDLAVAVNVLEHAIDPKAALSQLLRVVKSDGTLVAAAFAYADAKGFAKLRRAVQKHTHLSGRHEWTREQFEELLRRCGWEPERVEVLSGSFPFVVAECKKKEA